MCCSLYARDHFLLEVHQDVPDARISLAKACMLIALEEEAALEINLRERDLQRREHIRLEFEVSQSSQQPTADEQDPKPEPKFVYRYARCD